MLVTDLLFRDDDKWRAIVEEYAQDNDLFLEDFRNAWIKLVNGDRFGDVCVTSEESAPDSNAPIAIPEGDNVLHIENSYGTITVNCDSKKEKVKSGGNRRQRGNGMALAQEVSGVWSHSNWGTHIFAIIGVCAVLKSLYSACVRKSGDTLYQDISQEA